MVMLWLKLPEAAVMVAVYDPAGVPEVGVVCAVEDDPPPPQPITEMPASTMIVVATSSGLFRFHGSSVPSKTATQAAGAPPKGSPD